LLAVITTLLTIGWVQRVREPAYDGKALSEWFREIKIEADPGTPDPAANAMAAMGKDAAPFLMRQYRWSFSPLRHQFHEWAEWLSRGRFHSEFALNLRVSRSILALGPEAGAVVPELVMIARDPRNPARFDAMGLLGVIHVRPELAVPALEEILRRSDTVRSHFPAYALAEFGPAARSALPTLISRRQASTDVTERFVLSDAISKIDPEAAAREGINTLSASADWRGF
jgi:hypothetical protein